VFVYVPGTHGTHEAPFMKLPARQVVVPTVMTPPAASVHESAAAGVAVWPIARHTWRAPIVVPSKAAPA
jgi:hypothetical protein